MFLTIDLQNILLIITLVMNIFLGALIYIKHRSVFENQVYTLNIMFIVWWIVVIIIFRSINADLLFWTKILYLAPTFIASSFVYFSLFFPGYRVRDALTKLAFIVVPNIIIVVLLFIPGFIIESVRYVPDGENIITFGFLYPVYASYISLYFSIGLITLLIKRHRSNKNIVRQQINYLLVGYLFASILAMVTNLILPYIGIFNLNWLGQVLTLFMVIPVTYAIFQHNLFKGKIILTEILILSLSIILLTRVLLPQTTSDYVINGILFIGFLCIGILLIKSVNKEVHTREKVEVLAHDLEKANVRLRELDKRKSEFVSIASHQLRSPLTAMKGYTSMLLEGSYGEFPEKAKEPISRIFESTNLMVDSVEDFLNVSRIEQGRMKYNKTDFDISQLAESVVKELTPLAKKKGLDLSFKDSKELLTVNADLGKVKQVFNNLIDNSIKYTTKGSVEVSVTRSGNNIQFKVSDTGVGISKDTLSVLFDKFVRADNAHNVNVSGTGLGLYVARQMVEAHGGKIWAESDGESKGSTFFVELKAN